LITHQIADILPEIGRVILMRAGRIVADGKKEKMLTEPVLSELFGVEVRVMERDGFTTRGEAGGFVVRKRRTVVVSQNPSGSFDCVTHDEAVSHSAQDDGRNRQRRNASGQRGMSMGPFCRWGFAGGWALNQAAWSAASWVVDSRRSRRDSRASLRRWRKRRLRGGR